VLVPARLPAERRHTRSTHLGSRSTQRFSARCTGRSIHRQHVVINGGRICLTETCHAFIFAQDRAEHSLPEVALISCIANRRYTLKFIVVEHRYLSLTSPTPEHFHRWLKVTTANANSRARDSDWLESAIRIRQCLFPRRICVEQTRPNERNRLRYSGANASNTFPGIPLPVPTYPEPT